jgi:glycogen operon protein
MPHRDLRDYISETAGHADVRVGSRLPLGTQAIGNGVNFAIFTRNVTRVRLELFEHLEDATLAGDNH